VLRKAIIVNGAVNLDTAEIKRTGTGLTGIISYPEDLISIPKIIVISYTEHLVMVK